MRLNTGRTPSLLRRRDFASRPCRRASQAAHRRSPPPSACANARSASFGRPCARLDALRRRRFPRSRDEPGIDAAGLVNLVGAGMPWRSACATTSSRSGVGTPEGGAQHVHVVAEPQPLDFDFVETGQSGLQRTQRLLQRFRRRSGRSPWPRRPISSTSSGSARRRGISRRRSAGFWSRHSRSSARRRPASRRR